MSTDQQPTSYDPRYDGIYQRGGAASAPRPHVEARRETPVDDPSRTTAAAFAHEERRVDAPPAETAPEPAIRDLGAQPEAHVAPDRSRNPFDVWVWLAAAVLTGLGIFFLSAPIVYAEEYAEQMMSQSGTAMYTPPWYSWTNAIAPTLVLLGLGTAVVQVFVLSIRHTLRTR